MCAPDLQLFAEVLKEPAQALASSLRSPKPSRTTANARKTATFSTFSAVFARLLGSGLTCVHFFTSLLHLDVSLSSSRS